MTDELQADRIWCRLRREVDQQALAEPILASYLHATILNHRCLEDALSFHLAGKLAGPSLAAMTIREVISEAFEMSPSIQTAICADLEAISSRDPASYGVSEPFLHYKGFHALESYRTANWLWERGRRSLACYLQNRISERFGVDVHPAAKIGKGILIDHATSVVIGETAVVEDDVSMLHEVTLGGTGRETGDRHPKVRRGVLIGAGAKILGNVVIGDGAKVGAGSVVLKDVPSHSIVAGVPAKVVGRTVTENPALEMDHRIDIIDTAENSLSFKNDTTKGS
ncbi:MAG: serine O-acetyltransferase [Desulfobacterales bacterium]|jgi:serine O-acetyltransferase